MSRTVISGLLQRIFEGRHIGICVSIALGLAQTNTINDGRVVQRIRDHGVLRPKERFEQPSIGIKTGREQDRVVHTKEYCQLCFKLPVQILRSTDEADRRHAVSIAVHC